jgi:peptidoglycan/LPS O-acetylase OafA/YrhL
MMVTVENAKEQLSRRPELDGIRGVAILMVIALHYLAEPLSSMDDGWAVALGKSMRLFWTGVDLFFVLSGFLIGGILLQQQHAVNYFTVFFVRRTCRIWPLYFFVLALSIAVASSGRGQLGYEALDLGPVPLWSYFIFAQNILMAVHHDFGSNWLTVTWSLAVEEQFYLVLPFMVRFLTGRRLVYVALAGIVSAVLLRMYFSREFLVFLSAPTRADSVLAGLLLACAMRSPRVRQLMEEHVRLLMLLVAFGAVGMVLLTRNERLLGEGLHLWMALFYTGVIALVSMGQPRWLYRCLTLRWLQFTGIISYGLYLFHSPADWLVRRLLPAVDMTQPSGIFIIAGSATALTLVAATACYYSFERSFVKLGHRLRYRSC